VARGEDQLLINDLLKAEAMAVIGIWIIFSMFILTNMIISVLVKNIDYIQEDNLAIRN
jgi:hypothetical protein